LRSEPYDEGWQNGFMNAITAFGVVAVTFMMVMYALDDRGGHCPHTGDRWQIEP
jgi:hypothetical protein